MRAHLHDSEVEGRLHQEHLDSGLLGENCAKVNGKYIKFQADRLARGRLRDIGPFAT